MEEPCCRVNTTAQNAQLHIIPDGSASLQTNYQFIKGDSVKDSSLRKKSSGREFDDKNDTQFKSVRSNKNVNEKPMSIDDKISIKDESLQENVNDYTFYENLHVPDKNESINDNNINNSKNNQVTTGYNCPICHEFFAESENLITHMKTSHTRILSNRRAECPICNKILQHCNLSRHLKYHVGIRDFHCTICNNSFTEKSNLIYHMGIHSGRKKKFQCLICEKRFMKDKNLSKHMKTHNKKKRVNTIVREERKEEKSVNYECPVCHQIFAESKNLIRHIKSHIGTGIKPDKRSQCPFCSKVIRHCNMRRHLKLHVGIREFQCSICNKSFSQKETLKYHMTVHTGVKLKKFECDLCHKKFSRICILKTHMLTHSDSNAQNIDDGRTAQGQEQNDGQIKDKQMEEYSTASTGNHKNEEKNSVKENPVEKKFNDHEFHCIENERIVQLKSVQNLKENNEEQSMEESPTDSEYCNENIEKDSLHGLAKDNNINTGKDNRKCLICHKLFVETEMLIMHMKNHIKNYTDKKAHCPICSKLLYLCNVKRHLKSHVGIKDFNCFLCNKSFSQKESLKYHLTIHTGIKMKKFECDICHKQFGKKYLWTKHVTTHSTGKNYFHCSECKETFTEVRCLKSHARAHITKQQHIDSVDTKIECAETTENKNEKTVSISKKSVVENTNNPEFNKADVSTVQQSNDQKFEAIFIKEEPMEDDSAYFDAEWKTPDKKSTDIDSGMKLIQNNEEMLEKYSTKSDCYNVRNDENISVKDESLEGNSNDYEF